MAKPKVTYPCKYCGVYPKTESERRKLQGRNGFCCVLHRRLSGYDLGGILGTDFASYMPPEPASEAEDL